MLLIRRLLFVLPVLLEMSAGSSAAQGLPPVTVTGEPVAPSPVELGTGLCSSSSRSSNPATDFPQTASSFRSGVNAFLEANAGSRVTSVQRTPLDLSNNNSSPMQRAYGDFRDAVFGCPSGGCGFFTNDTTTSFATRLRGLLHVPSDKVNKTLHFGLYADDAVSLTLFDKTGTPYEVINRPPQLGNPSWRTTNSVTFSKPGLYPIEVLYAEIGEDAALELSMLEGAFTDFERPATQVPIVSLEAAGFALVTPAMFYLSESGRPSHPEPDRCVQCNRQDVNTPGSNGCAPGSHCNSAALCSPCDSAAFCGASCSPCVAPDACHVGVCDATGTCSFPAVAEGTTCPGGTCQAGVCRPDASTPDGGSTGPDGGSTGSDGGSAPDASTPDAGGGTTDAGGGATDAGGSVPGDDGGTTGGGPDGGSTLDAGTGPGGGDENPNPGDEAGGCGCGTGARALAPLSLLGLALLLRRVRRPRFD